MSGHEICSYSSHYQTPFTALELVQCLFRESPETDNFWDSFQLCPHMWTFFRSTQYSTSGHEICCYSSHFQTSIHSTRVSSMVERSFVNHQRRNFFVIVRPHVDIFSPVHYYTYILLGVKTTSSVHNLSYFSGGTLFLDTNGPWFDSSLTLGHGIKST